MTETTKSTLKVNTERMWNDLMKIAEFTRVDQPYTRRSFSTEFAAGRSWLQERFIEAGLSIRIDAAGNLIGRILAEGVSSAMINTIMLGSHSDTVAGGGRFDGVAGVIAALEIGRTLLESGIALKHNIEIVDFLAEEPSEFGLSCTGSRGMTGSLDATMLGYKTPNGSETLSDAISRIGGAPDRLEEARRKDIKAFFEMHIEQGPILERENIDIGLVTAIVGIRRVELSFLGEEDHAGTTPMNMRRDAAAAAAETMVFVRRLAEELASAGAGHFVATTGVVEVQPNAANVVPRSARLRFDLRAEKRQVMEKFYSQLQSFSSEIGEKLRVEADGPHILSDSVPSICDDSLRELLRSAAKDLKLSSMDLASGAGHDAAFLSRIAPAAMVFVPCRRGKSHASQEWAEPEALAKGANVLMEAILRLNNATSI